MNPIAKEIASYIGSAAMTDEEFLQHYGIKRRSGRYPWGSGKNDYQHSVDFLGRLKIMKDNGWKETPENIKKDFGMTIREFRIEKSLCSNERRLYDVARAKSLREKYSSPTKIGKIMGISEGTVRTLLNPVSEQNNKLAKQTAEFLKDKLETNKWKMIDVGKDVEKYLNISREKLDTALYILESQGYGVHSNRIPQPTDPSKQTTQKVLCSKDIKVPKGKKIPKEMYNYNDIHSLVEFISRDNGQTFEKKFNYPKSMDSKRMLVRYNDDKGPDGFTGGDKDGTIEIRRGVPDLNLGDSRYAQVRILIDGTHYAKGMAIYSDNMPDGIDVIFNTNKKAGTPIMSSDKNAKQVLKPIKNDPENPFGSAIKDIDQGGQYWYDSKTGKRLESKAESPNATLGLINKRADQGDWTEWKDALPSQFLSKQPKYLAKKQLDLAKANKMNEYEEIKSLTNPTIKKYYLEKFANSCDKNSVDLKAAALPGQKYHVIIPINTMKDTEVYAPQYENGTKVALIRYPHGGTFEIPKLTVNNKNQLAQKVIGNNSIDAIGITKKVADQLSGADFDGDTVMVIPTDDKKGKIKIQNKQAREYNALTNTGLKGFDTKIYQGEMKYDSKGQEHWYDAYGKPYKIMKNTDNQMGRISNLITDMTLLGANEDELERAVRHSMVVIDAEKHKLNWKQSEIDNNIQGLKEKYQRKINPDGSIHIGGSSTIVSRAKGTVQVPKTTGQAKINQKGKSWYDPNRPEGSLVYTIAKPELLYYADYSTNNTTGMRTIKTISGKKITYNMNDPKSRVMYDPVMNVDKDGNVTFTNKSKTIEYASRMRTKDTTQMANTDDAMTLVSPVKHEIELLYADYANTLKGLANDARLEMVNTKAMPNNPTAKKTYAKAVSSLEAKLNDAQKNSVKERQALRLSNEEMKEKIKQNPDMKKSDERKLAQRTVNKYRNEVGTIARRNRAFTISDDEWVAIQSGAVSEHQLKEILNYTDPDALRERAMPKQSKTFTNTQINTMRSMLNSNFTLEEISKKFGVSPSVISKILKGA